MAALRPTQAEGDCADRILTQPDDNDPPDTTDVTLERFDDRLQSTSLEGRPGGDNRS